jgi:hypothetical protein
MHSGDKCVQKFSRKIRREELVGVRENEEASLIQTLNKWDMWIGFIWLRMWSSGQFLRTW